MDAATLAVEPPSGINPIRADAGRDDADPHPPPRAQARAVEPPSGINPIRANASRNDADSDATQRSQASAIEQPTPAAAPCTVATTGLSQRVIARTIRLARSSARTSRGPSAPRMSAPAQKA